MEEADTPRTARSFLTRLAAASPWSRSRIAGEAVLTVALAGIAGLADAVGAGFGARTFAVVTGVALLSLTRRALPATVLVLSSAAAGGLIAAVPLLVYASWSAGSRIVKPWRVAIAYATALVAHTALIAHDEITAGSALSPVTTGAVSAGVFLALASVPGLAARYRAQRRALLDALRSNNAQLVREQAMVAREARLLERHRIARDMHDSLGHQLALISVHSGALQVDPELTGRQREGVRILRDASVAAMGELREAVGILREDQDERDERDPPAGPADGRPVSRPAASVDALVESSRAAGVTVELHREGVPRPLVPAVEHAAYRIAQEGLTNAHKHAPGAPISVALRYEPDSLVVEVANGPVPAAAAPAPAAVSGGQGLRGLGERARLVGGMVHTGPTADGGFRVAGLLPYGTGDGEPGPGPDGATSVGPGSDFGGQMRRGAAGDRGAVINYIDPPTEFTTAMTNKKNVAIGCAAIAVVLVGGIVALGTWGTKEVMKEMKKAEISPSVYESVKIGDAEADVQDKLPDGDSWLTSDLSDQGPELPEGATCRYFASDEDDNLDSMTVFRFCFRDGKLVAKDTYQAT
ncbi:two-component sensor histidine kinase [Streptomyces sp. KM273126]|uniref:sensor histidine kinase n=1 Tax=Streptomyces sp. KM273126 TaxID=2545247 RepID=UPI00103D2D96|nr:two-component sensor histidine kinase [Streptomyces sp. KM273126]